MFYFFLYYHFSDLQTTDFWLFEMHFILFICSTLETRKCDAKRLVLLCFLTRKDVADRQKTVSIYGSEATDIHQRRPRRKGASAATALTVRCGEINGHCEVNLGPGTVTERIRLTEGSKNMQPNEAQPGLTPHSATALIKEQPSHSNLYYTPRSGVPKWGPITLFIIPFLRKRRVHILQAASRSGSEIESVCVITEHPSSTN